MTLLLETQPFIIFFFRGKKENLRIADRVYNQKMSMVDARAKENGQHLVKSALLLVGGAVLSAAIVGATKR